MEVNLNSLKRNKLGDEVFDVILNLIISGEISPGFDLSINKLSEELDVSSTPVREALNKLVNQRLLKKVPYKGYKIRRFSEKDIKHIYEHRAAIESYACKLAAERMDEKNREELQDMLDRMDELLNNEQKVEYVKLHKKFHSKIINASENREIITSYKKITNLKDLIVSSITGFTIIRAENSINEHQEIIDGISEGDSLIAFKKMNDNIINAAEFIQENMEEIGVAKK